MREAVAEQMAALRQERALLVETLSSSAADERESLVDDFHSPTEPSDYIVLRLDRMKAHYQRKIPLFYNWRRFWELVPPRTVASATLSFLSGLTAYVVVATCSPRASPWNAHDDISKRIARYTNAVRSIERLQWWWKSLDDIDAVARRASSWSSRARR